MHYSNNKQVWVLTFPVTQMLELQPPVFNIPQVENDLDNDALSNKRHSDHKGDKKNENVLTKLLSSTSQLISNLTPDIKRMALTGVVCAGVASGLRIAESNLTWKPFSDYPDIHFIYLDYDLTHFFYKLSKHKHMFEYDFEQALYQSENLMKLAVDVNSGQVAVSLDVRIDGTEYYALAINSIENILSLSKHGQATLRVIVHECYTHIFESLNRIMQSLVLSTNITDPVIT